jgi:DNA-directed RNA polymerase
MAGLINHEKILDHIIPYMPIGRKASVEKYSICAINLVNHLSSRVDIKKRFRRPRVAASIAPSHDKADLRLAVCFLAELEILGLIEVRSHKEGIKTITETYPTQKFEDLIRKHEPNPNVVRHPVSISVAQVDFEVRRGIKQDTVSDSLAAIASTPLTINMFMFHFMQVFPPTTKGEPQYLSYDNSMKHAEQYFGKKFKLPYFLCSRGRAYDDSTVGFSTQGCDWEKALLQPVQKTTLDSSGYQALLEATYGYAEVDWTLTQILEMARSPVDTEALWRLADKPYMFMACADLLAQYHDAPSQPLPAFVPLDGKCSGLQHWSAVLRTDAITDRLGMTKQPNIDGLDMYEYVASLWYKRLPDEWKKYATRKGAKKPVMTFAYSATRMSAMDYMDELYGAKKAWSTEYAKYIPIDNGLMRGDAAKLGSELFNVTNEVLAPMVAGVNWLKLCMPIIIEKTGHARVQWITPDGFLASQYTVKWDKMNIEVRDSRKRKHKISLRVPQMGLTGEEVPSIPKAQSGIGPNVIHSLDATHLRMVALRLQECGIYGLWIHDSFAVHVNHRKLLYRVIVEEFIKLYSGNYLMDLKAYWEDHYGVKLPNPPPQGGWEPESLQDCTEFFA